MLAQAHECFFEKVITDSKHPALCSKIARQVGLYYEESLKTLTSPPLSVHFEKTWIFHVQLKAAHYHAEACYRYALDLHEKENIAEEIARLKVGFSALADAKKSFKGVTVALLDAVSKLESNMNLNLERALKENDRLYLMHVPDSSSLSSLLAVSLVKPTPMVEVLADAKISSNVFAPYSNKVHKLSLFFPPIPLEVRGGVDNRRRGVCESEVPETGESVVMKILDRTTIFKDKMADQVQSLQ